MPMSNPTADLQHDDLGRDVIILVDDETLNQDCMAEAMRSAFPHAIVVGVPSIDKLPRPSGSSVSLVLLRAKAQPFARDGLAADIRTVARHFPNVPVVVITSCDNPMNVGMAVAAGAQGVIPVTASLRIAIAALQLVLAGGTYYPQPVLGSARPGAAIQELESFASEPSMARVTETPHASAEALRLRSTGGAAGSPVASGSDHLMVAFTAREADVLAALQRGRSNKWIAHHLNLSENTVKVHIRHIMRKLRATNRTEAVVLSQQWVPDVSGR
jgi:two-component system, NarL family, nitrate/nitrite response regulator NarL